MKKEDREENMRIMFEKYTEHIQLCSVQFLEHDLHIFCVQYFKYICSETE